MPSPSDRRESPKSSATTLTYNVKEASKPQDIRTNMPRTASSMTSSDRSSSPNSSYTHQYLGDSKASDIASWTAAVPAKTTNPNGIMYDEVNPAVHAYMQMKMALFQSMSRSKQDKSSPSRNK